MNEPYIPAHKLAAWREANAPGRCPIINVPISDPVVDHDHATGRIRSVLQREGNSLLGKAENHWKTFCAKHGGSLPAALRRMADFLEADYSGNPYHPVGVKQLVSRFRRLPAEGQKEIVGDIKNPKERAAKYRRMLTHGSTN